MDGYIGVLFAPRGWFTSKHWIKVPLVAVGCACGGSSQSQDVKSPVVKTLLFVSARMRPHGSPVHLVALMVLHFAMQVTANTKIVQDYLDYGLHVPHLRGISQCLRSGHIPDSRRTTSWSRFYPQRFAAHCGLNSPPRMDAFHVQDYFVFFRINRTEPSAIKRLKDCHACNVKTHIWKYRHPWLPLSRTRCCCQPWSFVRGWLFFQLLNEFGTLFRH